MKCKSCGLEKDPSLFYKSNQTTCSECIKTYAKSYRKEKIDTYKGLSDRYLPDLWRGVVKRCENAAELRGYKNSNNLFENFQIFSDWCLGQYGHNRVDKHGRSWVLDKDIIVIDNYNYGPDECCFVPTEINLLVAYRNPERKNGGTAPIGTAITRGGKYRANFNNRSLGNYHTPEEAHFAWCDAKVAKILDVVRCNVHELPKRTLDGLVGHADFISSYRNRGLILPRLKGAQTISNRLLIDAVINDLIEVAYIELRNRGLEIEPQSDLYLNTIKECFYEIYKT